MEGPVTSALNDGTEILGALISVLASNPMLESNPDAALTSGEKFPPPLLDFASTSTVLFTSAEILGALKSAAASKPLAALDFFFDFFFFFFKLRKKDGHDSFWYKKFVRIN